MIQKYVRKKLKTTKNKFKNIYINRRKKNCSKIFLK